ncbi:MAG: small multi-drug export protein [Oscillospiraceae bacterium]|nr:small multi-drug export protein [Oscillospiraceae bacterium]
MKGSVLLISTVWRLEVAEGLVDIIINFFQDKLPEELVVFIISLLPVVELRGGMIAARLMEMDFLKAFLICYAANMLPIPFIILFIRKIFAFLRRFKFFANIIERLEKKTDKNKEKVLRYEAWGLLLFVAIPLPGTGGWTGALMAALLDIRMKKSLPIIAIGVLIAGFIMSGLTYGIFQL